MTHDLEHQILKEWLEFDLNDSEFKEAFHDHTRAHIMAASDELYTDQGELVAKPAMDAVQAAEWLTVLIAAARFVKVLIQVYKEWKSLKNTSTVQTKTLGTVHVSQVDDQVVFNFDEDPEKHFAPLSQKQLIGLVNRVQRKL